MFDGVIGQVCVDEGFHGGLETEFGVGDFASGLEELGYSYADDVDFWRRHGEAAVEQDPAVRGIPSAHGAFAT